MKKGTLVIEKNFRLSQVDERLFSSFLEHLGRAIYTGIYEPGHPAADDSGFRQDVIELVNELKVSHVRYPGGNFVSGYNWTDGIGPQAERPSRLDYAWFTIENNQFGIDEFVDWSKKAGTEIMAAVNMGTGTPQSAGYMLEYCNLSGGTYWSDLRKKNGHSDPHNIKLWCVGNEMDGPWQTGQLDPLDYGKKAREASKIMKWVDPSVELVVCGSSHSNMPSYPAYDRIVLEQTYDQADYISLHMYFQDHGNHGDFLASFLQMNSFIKTITSTADYVKTLKRSSKTVNLSFDEWNIWYKGADYQQSFAAADPIMGKNPPKNGAFFGGPPHLLENNYNMLDALSFGGLMLSLLNNADRVKIACLAQLVNVIAPIMTKEGGPAIRQTTFYPFRDISLYGRGTVLTPVADLPVVETAHGDAPIVYTSIVDNEEAGELTVFALNIDQQEDCLLALDLRSFGELQMVSHSVLQDSDLMAVNNFLAPQRIVPKTLPVISGPLQKLDVSLQKLSWNVLRFTY